MAIASAKSSTHGISARRQATKSGLMRGSALAGLAMMLPTAAFAQSDNGGREAAGLETVVVTGSLIRGVAHTGSDLITLNQEQMKQVGATTVQQLLNSIPSLTTFGTDGAFFSGGSQDASGTSSPTIHGIGAIVSDATLVLIDGHRIAQSGTSQTVSDPGNLPSIAIQRLEVLSDGASSLYGADAVAGVVNFITRADYSGFEVSAKAGHADHYQTSDINTLFGRKWDGGGMVFAYEYESRSNLLESARTSFTQANKANLGGSNLASFNCGPTTISQTSASSGTASNVYVYPYSGAAIGSAGNTFAQPCDTTGFNSIEPAEAHNAGFISVHQAISDSITMDAQFNYSARVDNNRKTRGVLSATVFGPTAGALAPLGASQINPFFQSNAAVGTASEFARVDFNDLLAGYPQAHTKSGANNVFANAEITGDLGGGWSMTVGGTSASDTAWNRAYGGICTACAELALNGTTNTSGTANTSTLTSAISDYYGLATITSVTRALTTLNAIDIWNPLATNKTSKTVLNELTASQTNQSANQTENEVRVKLDGGLFNLPAGQIKAAVGGQFDTSTDHQMSVRNDNIGPSISSSANTDVYMSRNVYSAFVEFFVPVISPEMKIPLVQKLDLDISGRYDKYSDFGATKNPKVGLAWVVTDGLQARASYGTSFTAPHFNSEGQKGSGITSATNLAGATASFQVPANHPNIAGSFCQTVPQVACNVTSAQPGIAFASGNPSIHPQPGTTYSVGLDFDAGKMWKPLSGFTADVTYWQVKYLNVIDQPQLPQLLTVPGLQQLLFLAPPGGWALTSPQVQNVIQGLPITGALPATVFYIEDMVMANSFNDQENGIDFSVHYAYDTGDYGVLTAGVTASEKLRFSSQGVCQPVGCPSTAPFLDFNNGIHNSSSEHATQFSGRASLNWSMDPYDVAFFWNFVNPYWAPTTTPPYNTATILPNGVTGGGYQKVAANSTFDLNVNYTLPAGLFHSIVWGVADGMEVSLHVSNILNTAPPFYNVNGGFGGTTASGYDNYNASPIGRMLTFGIQKKF